MNKLTLEFQHYVHPLEILQILVIGIIFLFPALQVNLFLKEDTLSFLFWELFKLILKITF